LKQFLADSEQVVRNAKSESEILRSIKPSLEKLLGKDGFIPEEAFKPRADRFAMNLLYMPADKSFSIIGGVWAPGQTTPIHDHLTWALIGVYRGKERENLYRRVDDRSNLKFAKLEKASENVNEPGHVTVLGHTGIHKVDNPTSDKTTYSVHVYGRDIGNTERHSYDPVTGLIGKFVSGYCTVLRDTDAY
jgi:predicted metal-dependent enzyme (double-stranded beta helix superfamily)